MFRIALAIWLASCVMVVTNSASAEPPRPPPEAIEIERLEVELDATLDGLDTRDCAAACEAVASMQRAAERICELEPGPRCEAARAKVKRAKQKVLAACPECDVAAQTTTPVKPGPSVKPGTSVKPGIPPVEPEVPDGATDQPADAPRKAPPTSRAGARRKSASPGPSDGGCAPCHVGGRDAPGSLVAFLVGAIFMILRRRRRF